MGRSGGRVRLAESLLANSSAGRAAPSPTGAVTQRAQGVSTMEKRPSAFSYDSKMNRLFFFAFPQVPRPHAGL